MRDFNAKRYPSRMNELPFFDHLISLKLQLRNYKDVIDRIDRIVEILVFDTDDNI